MISGLLTKIFGSRNERLLKTYQRNIERSIEKVESSELFSGTDWDNALRLAHLMKPPPDVIFFMSDGLDRDLDTSAIVRDSKKNDGDNNPPIKAEVLHGVVAETP